MDDVPLFPYGFKVIVNINADTYLTCSFNAPVANTQGHASCSTNNTTATGTGGFATAGINLYIGNFLYDSLSDEVNI